ncbi:MAG: hypothetical protein ACRC3B_17290, partial [Bacteroidia bacterium]
MMLQTVLQKINPKKLFLADAIGAAFSAFMLGVVLVNFESVFGISKQPLYVFALIPCGFAVYSFVCFIRFPKNWRIYMQIIAAANLLYC